MFYGVEVYERKTCLKKKNSSQQKGEKIDHGFYLKHQFPKVTLIPTTAINNCTKEDKILTAIKMRDYISFISSFQYSAWDTMKV